MARHLARQPHALQTVDRLPPALHGTDLQLPLLDQLGDPSAAVCRVQSIVVAQVLFGRHPQGTGRSQQQLPLRLGLVERWLLQQRRWQHPLRQIVQALEASSPGHGHQACGEQPFQRMFFRTPVPPWAGALGSRRQTARAQRTLCSNSGKHAGDSRLLLTTESRQLLINAKALARSVHAPAQQGIEIQRQQ
ncbi:hypothetical protein D3C77_565600 [compost metagenome]